MLLEHLLVFALSFLRVHPTTNLYWTENGPSMEFYDCVTIASLSYCRRPSSPVDLVRESDPQSCQRNQGTPHWFSQLRTWKVNVSTLLHQWGTNLEAVERYARYLRDAAEQTNEFICQCQRENRFGPNCEYGSWQPLALDVGLRAQFRWKFTGYGPEWLQLVAPMVCYRGVECDAGLLCLDWREICDGVQQCAFGDDESNCDLLEGNPCDEEEYRCTNGMCIPDVYFLDGDVDCAVEPVSSTCDDRPCPLHWWSCGDGQCIEERWDFQKDRSSQQNCLSRRDQFFLCETNRRYSMWTRDNGRCYQGNFLDSDKSKKLSVEEQCEYLLKCALSRGGDKWCICRENSGCANLLRRNCSSLLVLRYPRGAMDSSRSP